VITADDAAIACLRADMQDVDLADIQSALTGEGYGFALAVQGRLIGVLVVRGRDDAEAFDPEERSLVRALAREVAHALQAIAAADNIAFIAALAAGDVDQKEARERAQTLIAREPYENT
jgi:GAF domain-containing protein